MDIPNLPTDNLYKFVALSGVILVVASEFLVQIRISKAKENVNRLVAESEMLKFDKSVLLKKDSILLVEVDELKLQMERYKFDMDSSDLNINISELKKALYDVKYREYLTFVYTFREQILPEKKQYERLQQHQDELQENRNLLDKRDKEISIKKEQIKEDLSSITKLIWLHGIALAIGLIMAISGFRLWYLKVQKYLDIKLKKEAES
jgi:hypothetical protein